VPFGKIDMHTPQEVREIVDRHEQQRSHSCFQSAVEIVLKLKGVLGVDEYPEQSITANDGRGYDPFVGKKMYGAVEVEFEERKFPQFSRAAIEEGLKLLAEDIYPIYSFRWPEGSEAAFHGFVGFSDEGDRIAFITRKGIGPGPAERRNELELILSQKKTEILIVRITKR
jgi:hypothetical protein